ncbi:hypothetical protein JCM8202_002871 [Rhodotorula sphaerocarpa]
MSAKAAAERYQRQILALVKEPGNDQCADCRARNPRWAAWDHGVFLCVQCASMHRKLGTHVSKVKSLTLDTWSREQVENMRQLGNVRVNSFLNPDERRHPPPPPDSGDERNSELERFIRNKYEYKTFAAEAGNLDNGQTGPTPGSAYAPASGPPPPVRSAASPLAAASSSSSSSAAAAAPSPPPPAYNQALSDPTGPPLPARPPAASSSGANPTLPPRSNYASPAAMGAGAGAAAGGSAAPFGSSTAGPPRPKSVRFGESPPTVIPSPVDDDDEDDADQNGGASGSGGRPPLARSRTLPPPAKGILRARPGAADEIAVDWAAFTSPSPHPDAEDEEEDVPLGALGALGMRGAQVGMMGVPMQVPPGQGGGVQLQTMYGAGQPGQQQPGRAANNWLGHQHLAVPYGAPGGQSAGGGVPVVPSPTSEHGQHHQQQHLGPTVAPLQPQFTGSAKGYLHEQRLQQQQQQQQQQPASVAPLQPQYTGSAKGYLHQQRQQQQQGQGQGQGQQQGAAPPVDTNPFRSQMWTRNAYSGSPQPPPQQHQQQPQQGYSQPQQQSYQQQYQPPPQQQQQAQATGSNDIWADLDFLNGNGAPTPTQPSGQNASYSQQQQQQGGGNPASGPTPAALRPQLTGFVPSSSFGQQLARETAGATSSPSPYGTPTGQQYQQQPPSLTLQIPGSGGAGGSGAASPAPFGTGAGGGGGTPLGRSPMNGSPAFGANPGGGTSPLRPQLTGFVPSSSFGQDLARGGGASPGPGPGPGPGAGSGFTGAGGGNANGMAAPQPLRPQRTGFVPSSKFGLELAKESGYDLGGGGAGGGGSGGYAGVGNGNGTSTADEPAPFDLGPMPTGGQPNGAHLQGPYQQQQQQQQQPARAGGGDAFSNFASSFNAILPPQGQPSQQPPQHAPAPQQYPQPTGKSNPFLQPQWTGYMPQQQPPLASMGTPPQPQQQQPPPQQQQQQYGMMRPQLTGFAGANNGMPRQTNPFLAYGAGAGAGGQGWR